MRKLLVLLILIAAGYYTYTQFFAPPPGAPGMMGGAPPVGVMTVEEKSIRQWHEFSGRLVAVESAEIRPQVSGILQEVHFKEGQWVEKGQKLFTIDPRPYLAALQSAQAKATMAEAELQRAKKLIEEKAVPQRDYDQRRNDAEVARAELTQARLNYEYATIASPIAGRVGRPEITVGNLVMAGSTPVLTTVVSDKPIYADFDIDEQSFLRYVQSKNNVEIPVRLGLSGEEGTLHLGRVQSFDNQLNVSSGTLRVRAVFDNQDSRLIPGLFARLELGSAEETRALLIPDRAIGTDQNKKFVLVVGAENKVEHREVKLGDAYEGERIILEGLQPGEKIIVSGTQRVMMPGQQVTPEPLQQ